MRFATVVESLELKWKQSKWCRDGRRQFGEQLDRDGLAAAVERLCQRRSRRPEKSGTGKRRGGFRSDPGVGLQLSGCSQLQIQAAVQLYTSHNGGDQQHGV